MRVLEKPVGSSYSMGKKSKHKLRKPKGNDASDSSEEVAGRGCVHVSKSININTMKKNLSKQVYGECTGCAKNALTKKPERSLLDNIEGATSSDFIEEVEPVLWVCLQCGNQGCGRNSQEKHALKHYETPHSAQHNLVIDTSSWTAWCYACDDEVQPDKHKKLAECMEVLKKIAGVPSMDLTGRNGSGSSGGASSSLESGLNKKGTTVCQKVKGLCNLGNTCFFNAVLQNLVQTYSLGNLLGERKKGRPLMLQGKYTEESCSYSDEGENDKKNHENRITTNINLVQTYSLGNLLGERKKGRPLMLQGKYTEESCSSSDEGENDKKNHENRITTKALPSIEVSINDPGPLTQALVVFLHDINTTSRSGTISPTALFGQVCKKAPRFKGMQQQDSHELLRYLLDNMKTEEIKRGQLGILKHFRLSENTNPKKVDEEVKTQVKVYGREIKHTFVECLFGGQLISTVVCEECKFISQVLEPFLDLSLPVTEEKQQRPNQGGRSKKDSLGDDMEPLVKKEVDEVVSKYQMKKQKKGKKGSKKRGSAKGKSASPEDGEKEEEEEKGEKEELDEKDDVGDEKGADQEEKYYASDADVEDNLESDTSRCYNRNISDSILDEHSLSDSLSKPAVNNDADVEDNLESDTSRCYNRNISDSLLDEHSLSDSLSKHPADDGTDIATGEVPGTSFTFETSIDNHISCLGSSIDVPVVNGPVENGVESEEYTVTYTLTNGCLEESEDKTPTKDHSQDTNLEGGDNAKCVNSKESSLGEVKNVTLSDSVTKEAHAETHMNGSAGMVNGIHNVEDLDANKDKLSDVTSGVSSLSLDDKSGTSCMSLSSETSQLTLNGDVSLSSDISKLTLNGDIRENGFDSEEDDEDEVIESELKPKVEATEAEAKNTADTPNTSSVVQHRLSHTPKPCKSWKELLIEGKRRSINTLADRYHPISGECSVESCLHQFTVAELLTGNNKFGCKNCTKRRSNNNPNKEKKETVYSNANKWYLIFQPPAVLTLHLKRFEQVGYSSRKVNRHVDFPFVLDIAPYCSSLTQGIKPGQKKILYSLYGVVEHSGRLTSGHYTAYVKVRPNIGTLNNFLNKHHVRLKEYLQKYAEMVASGDSEKFDVSEEVNTDSLVPPGRWYHISDSRVNEVTIATVERAQAYLLFYERIY